MEFPDFHKTLTGIRPLPTNPPTPKPGSDVGRIRALFDEVNPTTTQLLFAGPYCRVRSLRV